MAKPVITIVGPGRLGSVLARALAEEGYRLNEIVYRETKASRGHSSLRTARKLARRHQASAVGFDKATFSADVVWLCVGDGAIAGVAGALASRRRWKGAVVFHSSGALTSEALSSLRRAGASVASVHPMMSFVHGGAEATFEVLFAIEGDARATAVARKIVTNLGGESLRISRTKKPLYHAFGAFLSPLIISHLALAERVGRVAGVPSAYLRQVIAPILATTVFNYISLGKDAAFSGPLVRGDVETIGKNLDALKSVPDARAVYQALAGSALRTLPVRNKKKIAELLRKKD